MSDFLSNLAPYWGWLILGVLLGAAEIVVPGFFLIWFAAAAIVTGLISMILPVPLVGQIGLFAVLAAILAWYGRRWLQNNPIASDDPLLNDRAARLVGETVTVVEPLRAGRGRVRVGDSVWNAKGDDAETGTVLRVTGSDKGALTVEPLQDQART